LAALVLSLVALAPALLALLAGSDGGRSPLVMVALIPLWATALALGLIATIALLAAAHPRGRWSTLRSAALLSNVCFWLLLGASLLASLCRM
jgi:hypothetical protein